MRRRREPWSFHDLVNCAGSVKMENFMQYRPTDRSKDSRLRLVFNNRVVAFRLGAHAAMAATPSSLAVTSFMMNI
jgi:hypothetical protein